MGARIHKYNHACSTCFKPKYKSCLFFFSYSTCCNLQQYRVREFAIFICKSFLFVFFIARDYKRQWKGEPWHTIAKKKYVDLAKSWKITFFNAFAGTCVCVCKNKAENNLSVLNEFFLYNGPKQNAMHREKVVCKKKKNRTHTDCSNKHCVTNQV